MGEEVKPGMLEGWASAIELTILVDQRETTDEEDQGTQQPQVVQATQRKGNYTNIRTSEHRGRSHQTQTYMA